MSDLAKTEISRLVEAVVRPLRARHSRKRRMRDELLAHLNAIYDEELQRLGDEHPALVQVKQRFGDPAEVSREIRKSLSWRERIHCLLEEQGWMKPRESLLHFIAKHVLFCTLIWVGLLALGWVRLVMPPRGTPGEFRVFVKLVSTMGIVSTIFSTIFVIVLTQLSQALHGSEQRSWGRIAAWGSAALLLVPGLMVVLWCAMFGEFDPPAAAIIASFCAAPLTLALGLVTSRQVEQERRYKEEWASIQIDG